MIKEEKSEEMTRQMESIWREHHDPEIIIKKKRKAKLEQELKDKQDDYGI